MSWTAGSGPNPQVHPLELTPGEPHLAPRWPGAG
jgi:hypothetical protein